MGRAREGSRADPLPLVFRRRGRRQRASGVAPARTLASTAHCRHDEQFVMFVAVGLVDTGTT